MRLGDDYLENLNFDVIFRTPGLLPTDPNLVAAREKGAVITSEMEAFFALCPCKTIAITGSDGKTTTSSIIAELLRASGKRVHLGGNIGRPLLTDVPDMLPEDIAVLELSSFQLHSIKIRPDIAVITNVSPNHLDVHPNFEDYVFAKRSIFINQNEDDLLVVNSDNPYTAKFANECKSRVRFFSRRETLKNGVFFSGCTFEAGNESIAFDSVEKLSSFLAAIPIKYISRLSPGTALLYFTWLFARKLLEKSAFIPQLVRLAEANYAIRWIPSQTNEKVKEVFDILANACIADLAVAEKKDRLFKPEEQINGIVSVFIKEAIRKES
ncbi:MAG: hypothetical protein EOM14_13325, partial [Clostridia bacterium]|nr:hypothetical protein [Clostridia bacterium]